MTYKPGRLSLGASLISKYSANATLSSTDHIVECDATSAGFTITLPSPAAIPPLPLGEIAGATPSGSYQGKEYIIKKIDGTYNPIYIATTGSETIDGYTGATAAVLLYQYDYLHLVTDGTNWIVRGPGKLQDMKKLGPFTVSLTATGQTFMFAVPSNKTFKLVKTIIEGLTTMSGGTSSVLKIGTSGNSYAEILSSAGITFASGTASSLLAVGAGVDTDVLGNNPASMSVAKTRSFAAGSVIQASVSGTVLTSGSVNVDLFGYLL